MAILDIESHAKHIGYTMTLAAAGFAYTDTKYDDGDKLFSIEAFGSGLSAWVVPAWMLPAVVVSASLFFFLAAIVLGVFALFGISGINQLTAQKNSFEASIENERAKRALTNGNATSKENQAIADLDETTTRIDTYTKKLKRRSERHLICLMLGFLLSAVLFADSKFDPNPPSPKCTLQAKSDGSIIVPLACLP